MTANQSGIQPDSITLDIIGNHPKISTVRADTHSATASGWWKKDDCPINADILAELLKQWDETTYVVGYFRTSPTVMPLMSPAKQARHHNGLHSSG